MNPLYAFSLKHRIIGMSERGKWMIIWSAMIFIVLFAAFLMHYIFGIYEVIYQVDHKQLYADTESTAEITVVPLNALGFRAPLRKAPAQFWFIEGAGLVDVVTEDRESGLLRLRAKNGTGIVIIKVKAKHSLLPSLIEIKIVPNSA